MKDSETKNWKDALHREYKRKEDKAISEFLLGLGVTGEINRDKFIELEKEGWVFKVYSLQPDIGCLTRTLSVTPPNKRTETISVTLEGLNIKISES
tara:strand:- start:600 stop:887 length:288 start_codon:yes stop_codon:yes gene_type:complete